MILKTYCNCGIAFLLSFLFLSCEDFVEVDAPNDKLVREQVFSTDATAISAMDGIYNELFLADFSSGYTSSVTFLAGLSADIIQNIHTTNLSRMQFQQNEILPDNENNLSLWSSAYNVIYMTNSFLEGIESTNEVSGGVKGQLQGEALFIRAFTYFYLVNLYGDVPLILHTDYRQNELAARNPSSEIYDQIITDLQKAVDLLGEEYRLEERTHVNKYAAMAMLARVYLYQEDWGKAEELSTAVINKHDKYEILDDFNEVFLANSKEAIWQISPIGGGGIQTQTNEGALFLIDPVFSFFAITKLNKDFVSSFDENDQRLTNWIGYNTWNDAYFAAKYKIWNSSSFPIEEYSMVLRLAEQYLIRAEARTQQGDIAGAIEDINVIRDRAGLELFSEANTTVSKDELLDQLMKERRKELFAEWGHRWLDLKRKDFPSEVLGASKTEWQPTDVLYPIPAEERKKDPNLTQNDGY